MKKSILLIAVALTLFSCGESNRTVVYHYPPTKTVDSADTWWGTTIPDPYRWLEDLKDPEVVDWFKAQSEYTDSILARIPGQDALIQEYKDLDTIVAVHRYPISKAGGMYFYRRALPNEQVDKLYYRQGTDGEEVLLFDPQQFVAGKTFDYTARVSSDGSRVLLGLSEAGSEIGDIRVLDVATAAFLPDVIPHSTGNFVDGSNTDILYLQFKSHDVHAPDNALNRPFKLHVLGTPVSSDIEVASSRKNPELHLLPGEMPWVSVSNHSPYMILGRYTVEQNLTLYYAPKSELKKGNIQWKQLTAEEDKITDFFLHGSDAYFLTTKDNPYFNIIHTSLENPDLKTAKVVVEGTAEWKISSVSRAKNHLVINRSKNELISRAQVYAYETGKLTDIDVPLTGNIHAGPIAADDDELLLRTSGWNAPNNYYQYDIRTGQLADGPFHKAFTAEYPNLDNIVYEEIEVPSHDGVLVPLSIIYDKTQLRKNGSNPCVMLGYGAYGISATPYFDPIRLSLLNRGVVMAIAHVRGGGEKGAEWHLAGKKATKPNTWKDFNACAEYLIDKKYTSRAQFGIVGGSAGGILIGRAVTERPDLYRVAIPQVGAMNTLRGEFQPNGPANIPEFGTVTDSVEFLALKEMDALYHVQQGVNYPAQLITTGWNDPRVASYLPAKYAAAVQAANDPHTPTLLHVNYAAGHTYGSTLDEYFAQKALEYAFFLWQTGHRDFQPEEE